MQEFHFFGNHRIRLYIGSFQQLGQGICQQDIAVFSTPDLCNQTIELSRVIGQGGRILRLGTADPDACFRQGGELPQDRHGHIIHIPVHEKDLVGYPASGYQPPVLGGNLLKQCIRAAVIPLKTDRDISRFTTELRGHATILTVVP